MNYFGISLILCLMCFSLFGQSFEGKIIYDVDFELNEKSLEMVGLSKKDHIKKLELTDEYFTEITVYLKEGNYTKIENSRIEKKSIYKSKDNLIYLFEKNSEFVTIIDAKKYSFMKRFKGDLNTQIYRTDSTKVIFGDTCQLIKMDWGEVAEEYYWYNENRIKINSELFQNHKFEYFNIILQKTNSYPLKITKKIDDFVTIHFTVRSIEEKEINEDIFKIPNLKISKRKEDKILKEMTGNKVMKIRN